MSVVPQTEWTDGAMFDKWSFSTTQCTNCLLAMQIFVLNEQSIILIWVKFRASTRGLDQVGQHDKTLTLTNLILQRSRQS